MRWIVKRGTARLCFCLTLFWLCRWTSAAPAENYWVTNRLSPVEYESNWSPLNYLATKAVGALVRVASFVFQWMPGLTNYMKPPKPTVRFANRSRDGYGFFDEDAYYYK